jgi:hypothetical protein
LNDGREEVSSRRRNGPDRGCEFDLDARGRTMLWEPDMKWIAAGLLAMTLTSMPVHAAGPVAGAHSQGEQAPAADGKTPEQRMQARFPQKVRVGDLIGLPVQDDDDRIIGYVTDVARTSADRIVLVMPEGGWFGHGGRPVPIPIETTAILARHLNLLDIPRQDVARLPTWNTADGRSIDRNEIIRVAIGRR